MMRQWFLTAPLDDGTLRPEHFELRKLALPQLGPGEILVRVRLLNIHAGTRSRIAGGRVAVGQTDPSNFAYAEVVDSRNPSFAPDDLIACQAGWQDYQVLCPSDPPIGYDPPGEQVRELNRSGSPFTYALRPELTGRWPDSTLMDVFGTSGLTAWFGLRECGPLTPADTVLIAGATGSVGSLAAQIAKASGATVYGLGGGRERCSWATRTLGLDGCLDYRSDDLEDQLATTFPDGISVFSDGAGGKLTETVVRHIRDGGRLFSYGVSTAFYQPSATLQPGAGLRELRGISTPVDEQLRAKHIRSELWFVTEFYAERLAAEDDLSRLLGAGALKPVTTVTDGFEKLPSAIAGLYTQPRFGKVQVRLST